MRKDASSSRAQGVETRDCAHSEKEEEGHVPAVAANAVLKPSDSVPEQAVQVEGIDFNDFATRPVTVEDVVEKMFTTGFQATHVGEAVRIINEMRDWQDPETGAKTTIFLGYTSNLISSGLRETFRYLVQHKLVSAIVTTAGGVEEDLIKCLGHTYLGSFTDDGAALRKRGMNRIGNLLVPNDNYGAFQDWVVPIFHKMLDEQESTRHLPLEDRVRWTPSKMIQRLGKEINDERSVCYWAYKNDIPIFSPAITDGSLGDMLFFHTFQSGEAELVIDVVQDVRRINLMSMHAKKAGMIILGGGVVKHHIANACLMRNGADYAVYINTAQEFDGSDAGARPDEAVSWGKIKGDAKSVKVCADATIVWPLIVAVTFAKHAAREENNSHNPTT